MTHNALSRRMSTVPMWIMQAVVGLLLSAGVAWTTWASVTAWKHDSRLSVVESKVETVKDDIKEIKAGNQEMNRKLDRLLEQRHER